MNEQYRQNLQYTTATGLGAVTRLRTLGTLTIRVTSIPSMVAANWAAIPDKLDSHESRASQYQLSTDSQPIDCERWGSSGPDGLRQADNLQTSVVSGTRFEFLTKYTFDKDQEFSRHMGIKWERSMPNSATFGSATASTISIKI